MINRIKVKMPYPIRVGFFIINIKKKIGFSFDNLATFLLHEVVGSNLESWVKENGENRFFIEQYFAAHKSYCLHEKKDHVNKERFIKGLSFADPETVDRIMKAATHAYQFGATEGIPNKKKVKK